MTEERKKIWKDFWKEFGSIIFLVFALVVIVLLAIWHLGTRAATVNGSAISRLQVIDELENESGEAMLESLVTKKLIAQKASEAGIKIEESEIDETIKGIEEQITAQGGTLDDALAQQGITRDKFREQVTLQKALERLLADKTAVSDEEVNAYLASAKVSAPEGMSDEEFRAQIKEQLSNQKLGAAAEGWIAEQKKNADIKYYVPYAPEPVTEATPEMTPAPEASTQENPQATPAN